MHKNQKGWRKVLNWQALQIGQQTHGENKSVRLLLGDVDAIKGFVYEGQKLPEIRGGSKMLVELEEDIREMFRQSLRDGCLVYCGGGSFLAIVPADEAEALKERIERMYLAKTGVATITVITSMPIGNEELVHGLLPHDETLIHQLQGVGVAEDLLFSHFEAVVPDRRERKNFGEWVARLSADLQKEKLAKCIAPFFPSLPIHQRCQSCGRRAANRLDTVVTPNEWLCEVCHQKRQKGRKQRGTFTQQFAEWFKRHHGQDIPEKPAEDLDDLGGAERRLAFLYADGNNMGDLLQRAKTQEQYRDISEALATAVRESLFEALVEAIGKERLASASHLPFEIIAIGGDDVTVIVPAPYGWLLAVKLLQKFEEHTQIQRLHQGMGTKLTMAAGLVIADVKYPVSFMQRLAEGLLKEAKRSAKEKGEGCLCHLWLRSPIASEDAKAIFHALYRRNGQQERWLTARPYTLGQAKCLTTLLCRLRDLPPSQRRLLAEALEKGVYVSLNTALYQVKRRLDKQKRMEILDAFQQLGDLITPDLNQERLLFWRQKDGKWHTALLDALELLELGVEGHGGSP
ncbi:MAG: hypothetical protein OGMRLDGQ_001562 [Candidatus Fervidibacter sp.]